MASTHMSDRSITRALLIKAPPTKKAARMCSIEVSEASSSVSVQKFSTEKSPRTKKSSATEKPPPPRRMRLALLKSTLLSEKRRKAHSTEKR
jgi:hypothetical protein